MKVVHLGHRLAWGALNSRLDALLDILYDTTESVEKLKRDIQATQRVMEQEESDNADGTVRHQVD